MRPSDDATGIDEYECLECGARVTNPDTPVCDDCDVPLRSLDRARDL